MAALDRLSSQGAATINKSGRHAYAEVLRDFPLTAPLVRISRTASSSNAFVNRCGAEALLPYRQLSTFLKQVQLLARPDPRGAGDVVPGFPDQRELELLVDAGVTPLQAIWTWLKGEVPEARSYVLSSLSGLQDCSLLKRCPSRRALGCPPHQKSLSGQQVQFGAPCGRRPMTLWQLFQLHTGHVIHKWPHYFPIYEAHLSRFVGRPLLIVEVGCGRGGSLQLWKKYFGPDARIVGIDVRPECAAFEEQQISIRIGSQDNTEFLHSVLEEFGTPDVVLDDGSHLMAHVADTFDFLYPKTSPTGVYMVEDLHTAYWKDYGGGLREPNSFIERAKSMVDELNQKHLPDEIPDTPFSRSTSSISFYDSMVVFERAPLMHHYHTMMPPQPPGSPGW